MVTIMPLPGYPWAEHRVSNVTPFTYRDGATYLQILENLKKYIRETLIPWIEQELKDLQAEWRAEFEALLKALNEYILTQQISIVEDEDGITGTITLGGKEYVYLRQIPVVKTARLSMNLESLRDISPKKWND